MGGVPPKHLSKSKVGRRRSHLALKKEKVFVCPTCKGPLLPHRACGQCGSYKGKKVAN
jgi:large subunit ribosomal protein L32